MPYATGQWCHPPELPKDPKALCLVVLEHPRHGRSFQIMRYVRNNWQFQEGLGFGSGAQRIVAWAVINADTGTPVNTSAKGAARTSIGALLDGGTMEKLEKLK